MTAITANLGARLKDFGELVKFSHTVFLFPFAMSSVLLAHREEPLTWNKFFWIVLALVAARTAAMVWNRITDLDLDARNPRTALRPLVTGRVSTGQAVLWLLIAVTVFTISAGMLNRLCLYLSPFFLAWVLGYSFAKRFTALSHIWLGMATSMAPLGAWLAMTGRWDWGIMALTLAVCCWVAGFDIIYACQDLEFDRKIGLHSIPARLGLKNALWMSRGLHACSLVGFFALGPIFGLGGVYLAGMALIAVLLIAEQALVARKRANIPMAFFTFNGMISVFFFVILAADLLAD